MQFARVLLTCISVFAGMIAHAQERCATVPYNEVLNDKFNGLYDVGQFEKWMDNKIRLKES
ncbi:MAG: hypothetical protein PVH48_09230, partial [Cyclobacteriaceae bacterium]